MVGEASGEGFNINVPFNGRKMGDAEYAMAFQSVVLPVAQEFRPELVLVAAGFDAARGDPLGGYCLSPAMYGHMTQVGWGMEAGNSFKKPFPPFLPGPVGPGGGAGGGVPGGRLLPARHHRVRPAVRQGPAGRPPSLPEVWPTTEPHLTPIPSISAGVKPGAVETVRNVIRAQAPYWGCLEVYGRKIPEDLAVYAASVEESEVEQQKLPEEGEEQLSRSFRKMEVES